MGKKKQEYQDYLKSEQWKDLRAQVYQRAQSKCELCGRTAAAIHHIKYPKNYSEDSLGNLVAVCKRCHMKLHGINHETLVKKFLDSHNAVVLKYTKQILNGDLTSKTVSMELFILCEEYVEYYMELYNDTKTLAGD